jgi:NCAIR mutase (PurE)-related protein
MFDLVKKEIPEAVYYPVARIISIPGKKAEPPDTRIAVITAGTSDMPVAEEAAVTAELLGNNVLRIYDAGVAGIHRLVDKLPEIKKCRVIIVIAGMEGALASVVGGLVDKPVIAVPTSVGYGANFGGISALLAMLTSCSSGVTVVNIDNGFGAGFSASMINQMK